MDENNSQIQESQQPTKKEKAEQAGKNVAEAAAKGAATYFGGPLGGEIANKIAQTKLGQNVLNKAGQAMAKNPIAKNTLSKAQPMLNSSKGVGSDDAGVIGTNGAANNSSETSNSSNLTSGGTNNSGFGNNKSGLFSSSDNGNNNGSAGLGITKNVKKSKTALAIISAVAPVVLPVFMILVVAFVVIGQVMIVVQNIQKFVQEINMGIEKWVNFTQGDGWYTNEESFFYVLNQEYEKFPFTGGNDLDIPLIAATIHYSTTVDFEQFEETTGGTNSELSSNSKPILGILDRDNTVDFYKIAKAKLGSVNTIWPGQKRLLGHVVKTTITVEMIDYDVAGKYWLQFFNLFNQSVSSTIDDAYWNTPIKYVNPLTAIQAFLDTYNKALAYINLHQNALAGLEYDAINLYYELTEFVDSFADLFSKCNNLEKDGNGNIVNKSDQDGLFRIPAPVIKRTMNYGYDEYKQMKQDLVEIRAILSRNGVSYVSDSDALKQAERSSNTELKKLVESYKNNKEAYEFSYTHYLQEVYIPFTYFYKKDYTKHQVDAIIDEIYDQRDFYNYLIGEITDYRCGGSCSYPVNGEEIRNLKVRLLQCSDGDLGEPISSEGLIDFEKYILGVVYAEIGDGVPAEAAKAQAIAARSFALTRAKEMGNLYGLKLEKENDNWVLSIRNCTEDQVYCDPDKGCSNTTDPSESGNSTTVYSGVQTKQYKYKDPLPEDSKIRSAVSSVVGKVLLDEDGEIVVTSYSSIDHNNWVKQANEGMDYTEILLEKYKNGRTISTSLCNNVCNKATGDYTQWKQCGSSWSNVIMSSKGCGEDGTKPCNICNIGCTSTSIAMQIARSGVSLTIPELNPETFVETLLENGKYTSGGGIHWNGPEVVAPSFKWNGEIDLTGLTRTQKAVYLQNLINEGYYLVMEVKCDGQHWVAIDYVEGDKVYVMDPSAENDSIWDRPGGNTNYSCSNLVEIYKVVK